MPSHVYGCIDMISVVCSLWFLIPRENIPQYGTLYVSPYFDVHGFFLDRANMTLGISKEAAITFRIQTWLHPPAGSPTYAFWNVLSYDGHNLDESGRVDYTGYNQAAQGSLQVAPDETVLVQIVARAGCLFSRWRLNGAIRFSRRRKRSRKLLTFHVHYTFNLSTTHNLMHACLVEKS